MPKYRVKLQQFSEELAEVEVEADNPAEAAEVAIDAAADGEANWEDGDHCTDLQAIEVYDESYKLVWEIERP